MTTNPIGGRVIPWRGPGGFLFHESQPMKAIPQEFSHGTSGDIEPGAPVVLPWPLPATEAAKLATAIQIITQDLLVPLEVCPRFDCRSGELTRFTLSSLIPDATVSAGSTTEATAGAIASQLDVWATRFAAAAGAIRERFAG